MCSGRGDGVHPGDGWMAILQGSVRHHARGHTPHSVGTKNSRGDSASIILQAFAQGRSVGELVESTASVVQAPTHLENKMEASTGVRGMVVASTRHQGVVLGERREVPNRVYVALDKNTPAAKTARSSQINIKNSFLKKIR